MATSGAEAGSRDRQSVAMRTSIKLVAAALIGLSVGTPPARAQIYPSQPIRLIVPFAPGGGMETAVRMVVRKINLSGWPQLIIDNRPGGAGTIAAVATKQAAPDGYTLMLIALSTHAINVSIFPDLRYDPIKDFTPIVPLFSYPSVVAVPANSPARSLADLVEIARTRPGGISYASPGIGTVAHILGLMFENATKTKMVHVPYRGGGPVMTDLLAGRIDFIIQNPSNVTPNVRSGQLRALAVTSKTRLQDLPDVPTMAELGYPDVFLDGWFGIAGPAGLPDEVVRTIHDKFAAALTAPDLGATLAEQGWTVDLLPAGQFRELIKSDIIRLGNLLKETGASLQGAGAN
jgi:tripartite-type tricarboxylate transporter receptor subunit TctC